MFSQLLACSSEIPLLGSLPASVFSSLLPSKVFVEPIGGPKTRLEQTAKVGSFLPLKSSDRGLVRFVLRLRKVNCKEALYVVGGFKCSPALDQIEARGNIYIEIDFHYFEVWFLDNAVTSNLLLIHLENRCAFVLEVGIRIFTIDVKYNLTNREFWYSFKLLAVLDFHSLRPPSHSPVFEVPCHSSGQRLG